MRIVGMLRVRNEARWIVRVLDSISALCRPIYVMDDHSEDDTAALATSRGAAVLASPFVGLDETRDKNWLLDRVMVERPDWILCIDGDEILEPGGCEKLKTALRTTDYSGVALRVRYLWNDWEHFRSDGVYANFWRPSLFRGIKGLRFKSTSNGGNFHCGNIPCALESQTRIEVNILHVGYMLREDRLRKYEWYNRMDPGDMIEDEYRHMVIGDLFPADSAFRWAGPLQLEALNV